MQNSRAIYINMLGQDISVFMVIWLTISDNIFVCSLSAKLLYTNWYERIMPALCSRCFGVGVCVWSQIVRRFPGTCAVLFPTQWGPFQRDYTISRIISYLLHKTTLGLLDFCMQYQRQGWCNNARSVNLVQPLRITWNNGESSIF